MPAAAIDPDDYLDFARDAPVTREEGRAAWEAAYAALEERLAVLGARARLFVVFGLQAGGKSTWVRERLAAAGDDDVYFAGPLPSRAHRARALALARDVGCDVTAVWVRVSLEVALARNAQRTGRRRVPDDVIRHVHASLEAPTRDEGFADIVVVDATMPDR